MHFCITLAAMDTGMAALEDFLTRVTGGASRRSIAEAADLDPSTLTRQLSRGRVPVQTIVAICRAYAGDFTAAFVAAGYITDEEAAAMSSSGSLRAASDFQLAQEILRRLQEGSASESLTEPIGHGDVEDPHTNPAPVIEGRFGSVGSRRFADDAAALERETSHHDEDLERMEEP